jgi:hypothetical protein
VKGGLRQQESAASFLARMKLLCIVLPQQIAAEIILEVAPDGVNVIAL